MTDKFSHLDSFVSSIVTGSDTGKDSFHSYLIAKIKTLRESEKPIRLDSPFVIVKNKKVGTVENNHDDPDTGIVFTEYGSDFTQEFDNIQELFQFLINRYKIKV